MNYYIIIKKDSGMVVDYVQAETPPTIEADEKILCQKHNFEPPVDIAQYRHIGDFKFEKRYMKDGSCLPDNYYFYDDFIVLLNSKHMTATLQYKELDDGYLLFFEDANVLSYCRLNNIDHADEIQDFETNYKIGSNSKIATVESSTNWLKTRSRKASGDIYLNWVYFDTSTTTGFDNGGDTDYSIIVDGNNTYIDFNPSYNYEIEGGIIRLIGDLTGNSIKFKWVFAPDIPVEYGGSYVPVNNIKFDNEKKFYEMKSDVKLMKEDGMDVANKIRLHVEHGENETVSVEYCLFIFKV